MRGAKATDRYTLRGGRTETWRPHFTLHGFPYVEVTGLKVEPRLDTVTGVVVASDTPPTLTFETSSPAIDQLQRNIVWSQRAASSASR